MDPRFSLAPTTTGTVRIECPWNGRSAVMEFAPAAAGTPALTPPWGVTTLLHGRPDGRRNLGVERCPKRRATAGTHAEVTNMDPRFSLAPTTIGTVRIECPWNGRSVVARFAPAAEPLRAPVSTFELDVTPERVHVATSGPGALTPPAGVTTLLHGRPDGRRNLGVERCWVTARPAETHAVGGTMDPRFSLAPTTIGTVRIECPWNGRSVVTRFAPAAEPLRVPVSTFELDVTPERVHVATSGPGAWIALAALVAGVGIGVAIAARSSDDRFACA